MTDETCTICGYWRGLHQYETMRCPANGQEDGQFLETTYTEKSDELASLRAENAKLREALIKAESALTYANWDGVFDDSYTAQDVINARDAARRALESSNE